MTKVLNYDFFLHPTITSSHILLDSHTDSFSHMLTMLTSFKDDGEHETKQQVISPAAR